MIWLKQLVLALTLSALPTCSTVREVPVPVFPEACDPGPAPEFPTAAWTVCGNMVCLTPEEGGNLYVFKRDYQRWRERVQVCTDTQAFLGPGTPIVRSFGIKGLEQMQRVQRVVNDLTLPGIHVSLIWSDCSHIGGYLIKSQTVSMCYDALDSGVAHVIAAHEMGHAIIRQKGMYLVDFQDGERLADEIAGYYFVKKNDLASLADIADWFAARDYIPDVGELHPRPGDRALKFGCWSLDIGPCPEYRRALVAKWDSVLKD